MEVIVGTYLVKFYVPGIGYLEIQIRANSMLAAQAAVRAQYAGKAVTFNGITKIA
jgi:hypothetical protein